MDSRLSFQSTFLLLVFIIFLVSVEVPVSLCSYDWYPSCNNRFNCGNITDVGYPFRGDGRPDGCGHPDLKLNCWKNITSYHRNYEGDLPRFGCQHKHQNPQNCQGGLLGGWNLFTSLRGYHSRFRAF
jgi:hypothetical protein